MRIILPLYDVDNMPIPKDQYFPELEMCFGESKNDTLVFLIGEGRFEVEAEELEKALVALKAVREIHAKKPHSYRTS